MDQRLVAWARAVKARRARAGERGPPVLWLFTDAARLPDPMPAAARLPKGLCGVVFRHDGVSSREALGRALARICRARRLALVVAGDARLAARLRAGLHLRRGRRTRLRPRGLLTSSAHDRRELARARRAGAGLVFLGPVFPTASHPGARTLGPRRWAALARAGRLPALALGGIDGAAARALPRRFCAGAAAIGALA
ncbi:MAG: thiamine phosphate synthase [Alphaproteobacteria bacterium]|nr:thiamine phosphate synthase [Alphaproteobacteria bacterium]